MRIPRAGRPYRGSPSWISWTAFHAPAPARTPTLHRKALHLSSELVPGRNNLPGPSVTLCRDQDELPRDPERTRAGAKQTRNGTLHRSSLDRPPGGVPEGFTSLLAGFRDQLDRALGPGSSASARRRSPPARPETLELIDGVGQLATQGGKRLRPALVYYTYRACGGTSDEEVLPLALSTELLHTYLLIHDDIMDHAEVRRGLPAAHVRFSDAHRAHGFHGDADDFGRSVAILLGDLAQSWAVELAAGSRPAGRAGRRRARPLLLRDVPGGHRRPVPGAAGGPAARGDARRSCCGCCASSPAATRPSGRSSSARCWPARRRRSLAGLSRYGAAVGEAFQLQDDLLGMFGDAGDGGQAGGRRPQARGSSPSSSITPWPRPPRSSAAPWKPPSAIRRPTAGETAAARAGAGGDRRARGGRRRWSASGCAPPAPLWRRSRPDLQRRGPALPRRADRLPAGARAVSALGQLIIGDERDRKAEHIRLALDQRMQLGAQLLRRLPLRARGAARDRHRRRSTPRSSSSAAGWRRRCSSPA